MKLPFLRSTALLGFPEFVRSLGGNPSALLEEVGIDPDLLGQDDRVFAYAKGILLYELAALDLNEPNFGLKLALSMPPHFANYGPVVFVSAFEKTGRSWFRALLKFQEFYSDGEHMELIEYPEKETAVIRMHTKSHYLLQRQYSESRMAASMLLAQTVLKSPVAKLNTVRFTHAKPENTELHQKIFQCDVEFGAEYNEVEVDRPLLDIKLAGRELYLKPLLHLYMQNRMRKMPQFDMSVRETVAIYIRGVLGIGKCSLEAASVALLLKEKKLQRLLAEEGTSFSKVLDDVRHRKSVALLRNPDLKIRMISGSLDYANTAAFTTAFHRWKGMSPVAYRQLLLENNEMFPPH